MPVKNDESAFQNHPEKGKKYRGVADQGAKSEYPTAHTWRTPGNMITHEQEEPGKTSVMTFHPSGHVRAVYPDGSFVEISPALQSTEADGQVTTIKHNQDTNVGGHSKMSAEGGTESQVAGTMAITMGGTGTINFLGDAAIAVNGNAKISAAKNVNLNASEDLNIHAKGTMNLGSDGGINIQSTEINLQPKGDGNPGYEG